MPREMQIGAAAQETGLTVDTIRFYEKAGLLNCPPRTEGGYRLFRLQDLQDLKFIRQAQQLGFSLQEIRELLFLQGGRIEACAHVRELLGQKLAMVRAKIEELRRLEETLASAWRKCDWKLRTRGSNPEERCPVLAALGRTDGNRRR